MTARCACCGQVIPPRSLFEHQPVKQAIYEYVAAHPEGVTRDQLMAAVYSDRIDGGLEWPAVISVHLHEMRPVLARGAHHHLHARPRFEISARGARRGAS